MTFNVLWFHTFIVVFMGCVLSFYQQTNRKSRQNFTHCSSKVWNEGTSRTDAPASEWICNLMTALCFVPRGRRKSPCRTFGGFVPQTNRSRSFWQRVASHESNWLWLCLLCLREAPSTASGRRRPRWSQRLPEPPAPRGRRVEPAAAKGWVSVSVSISCLTPFSLFVLPILGLVRSDMYLLTLMACQWIQSYFHLLTPTTFLCCK